MEDMNMVAADCVVICCCCQCLFLQIIILVLLKLPYKLIRRTKRFAKRKLQQRKKGEKMVGRVMGDYVEDFVGINGGSLRIEADRLCVGTDLGCGCCCLEEVEKVLEELSQKGEFGFGSFWGRNESDLFQNCVEEKEIDNRIVQYHLIEVVN